MKLTYKQRIFLCFFALFALFAIGLILVEQRQEKNYKTEALEKQLNDYTEIVHLFVKNRGIDDACLHLNEILAVLPQDMRVTLIDEEGKVLFDNDIVTLDSTSNHLDRPEIRKSLLHPFGTTIRHSASTQHDYLYFAKHYSNYFVRVALPYNVQTQNIMKADNLFIYISLVIFVFMLLLLNYVIGRFGKSISQLQELSLDLKNGKSPRDIKFPKDELGEIGMCLLENFKQIKQSKKQLYKEKEKLIKHLQYSEGGLCIFSPDKKKIYANSNFIQYLNFIIEKPTFDVEVIFEHPMFVDLQTFLNTNPKSDKVFSYQLNANNRIFCIQVVYFDDESFEINIKDISSNEQTRLLKQEMTSNIAHELRTPITSLRAYLETLSEQSLPADRQSQFIHRSYLQALRLSNLIEDISLISKIEDAPSRFSLEPLNLFEVIDEVRIDLIERLESNNIKLCIELDSNLKLMGNHNLIYSIFRNLIDNSIAYAGENISIYIRCYMEDENYLYFSYHDTGKGVKEEHLGRLFERFYRADEGRTRNAGGSGLGLSIVKNAILFHKGKIQVRNHTDGGLEFLFSFKKNQE